MQVASTQPRLVLAERVAAARVEAEANMLRLELVSSQLWTTLDRARSGRSDRQILHDCAFARLLARLESLPVIEQAKGILVAQTGCAPEQAFDMLRRMSQRTNVPVRSLAAEIVQHMVTAAQADGTPAA